MLRTALYQEHLVLGARMVDFAGWEMPVQYVGVIEEHRAVRSAAGLFDLGHMGEIWVRGPGAGLALDQALVSAPSTLTVGRAGYSIIVDERGGMLDDLVVYRVAKEEWLVVANASNADLVAGTLAERIGSAASVTNESDATAMIAFQGPRSMEAAAELFDGANRSLLVGLRNYEITTLEATLGGEHVRLLAARTGYTGEDGVEFYLPQAHAVALWRALLRVGRESSPAVQAIGLGARDTLRLEAGMPLYGNELRVELTPYDVGLGRVVKLGKASGSVGEAALAERAALGTSAGRVLVGLKVIGRGIARHGYEVRRGDGRALGTVTSGTHSPTLGYPIALADLDAAYGPFPPGTPLEVLIRGESVAVEVTGVPFIPKRTTRRG